jgi:hypothetical protein
MREQSDIAGFQDDSGAIMCVQLALTIRNDMERRPTGFLQVMRGGPLRTKTAELLQLRPHAEQRRQPCEDIRRGIHGRHLIRLNMFLLRPAILC